MARRDFGRRGLAIAVLLLVGAVVAGCAEPRPALVYAERPCYRTLGTVDCHSAPLPGEESRRVGFYDTPIAVVP